MKKALNVVLRGEKGFAEAKSKPLRRSFVSQDAIGSHSPAAQNLRRTISKPQNEYDASSPIVAL